MNGEADQFEKLSAYVDGDLSDADTWDLEKAVASDPKLAAELRALRATREALRALPTERAPEDFVGRVLERAERRHLMRFPSAEKALKSSRWITAAAAAVVLLAAGFGGFMMVQSWTESLRGGHELALLTAPEKPATSSITANAADSDRLRSMDKGGSAEDMPKAEPSKGDKDAEKASSSLAGAEVAKGPPPVVPGGPVPPALAGVSSKGGMEEKAGDGYRRTTPGGFTAEPAKTRGGEAVIDDAGGVGTDNMVFTTDNLALARRDVEAVLASNGIQPAVLEIAQAPENRDLDSVANGAVYQSGGAKAPLFRNASRANVYQARSESPQQVRIEVFVAPDQMAEVRDELVARLTSPPADRQGQSAKADAPDYLARLDEATTWAGEGWVYNTAPADKVRMYKKAMLKETLPAGETEMFTDHEPGRSSKDLADANGQPSAKQGVSAGTDMPRSGREAGAAGQVAEESVREKPEQQLARPALGTPMASQPATQLADRRATPLEVGANLRRLVITLNLGAPAAANAARIAVPPDAATLEQTEYRPARD